MGVALPFVGKPVHLDDATFLAIARGAAADPGRPHAFTINWQGVAEPAFVGSGHPPVETRAPCTFADDPYDVVTGWRGRASQGRED